MEKKVKKYIRENANRIWKDNEDKTFHYPKVKEEYLAITKKELQRFAEIMVEDVEKLFSQELDKAREEGFEQGYKEAKFDCEMGKEFSKESFKEVVSSVLSKLKDNK